MVRYLQHFKLQHLLSLLPADDMDSLQVEMSGLLKELHCPSEELVSGILKGRLLKAKDHLKCLCTSSLLNCRRFSFSPFLGPYQLLTFLSYPVFLSSELQAAQISQCGRVANTQDSSPGHEELLAMCSTLSLPEAAGQDAAGVLSQVREAVGTRPVCFEWPMHEVY